MAIHFHMAAAVHHSEIVRYFHLRNVVAEPPEPGSIGASGLKRSQHRQPPEILNASGVLSAGCRGVWALSALPPGAEVILLRGVVPDDAEEPPDAASVGPYSADPTPASARFVPPSPASRRDGERASLTPAAAVETLVVAIGRLRYRPVPESSCHRLKC
jgi:hypothetical protein